MELKFKFDASGRIHKNAEWTSNGHWLLKNALVEKLAALKPRQIEKLPQKETRVPVYRCRSAFQAIAKMEPGSYFATAKNSNDCPDMNAVIPKDLSRYVPVHCSGKAKFNAELFNVYAVLLESESPAPIEVGIAPEYIPLCGLGRVFACDKNSPVIVRDADDSLIAVIMPVRI